MNREETFKVGDLVRIGDKIHVIKSLSPAVTREVDDKLGELGYETEATYTEYSWREANPTKVYATRLHCPALDAILGQQYPVLDQGFVRVIDYMGSDASIVQAARISYGVGTKSVSDDRGLIRYLMRNKHSTPFEMCEIKLHVRVPMDTWRQWIRHRMASVNEYSTRYSEAIDANQATDSIGWRSQSKSNKQGSGDWLPVDLGKRLSFEEAQFHEMARAIYQNRLEAGVAREQARKDLPLSTYTEAFWKIDLHNLLHFLQLRMDSHAQYEIRQYANLIGEIVKQWCPITWEAFQDYRINAINVSYKLLQTFSLIPERQRIVEAIGKLGPELTADADKRRREIDQQLVDLGMFSEVCERHDTVFPTREFSEFLNRLESLGFDINQIYR